MSLKLENITKSFRGLTILDRFSLELGEGTITCLFGPSGCGKTTLLNLMAGILRPDSGTLTGFDGTKISCIFQEPRILPWKTVLGNVRFPLLDQYPPDEADEIARRFVRLVGLEKEGNLYPAHLSGGMKQRVSIARAFAWPGSVILMDEAFQNLDNRLKYNILDAFRQIWEEDRRTVIFVTHDIDEAIRLGQQIIFLGNRPIEIIRTIGTDGGSARQIGDLALELYGQ
jgi:NitT/TauT family transport system ATP-binding protein